ncbi:MAG TPA: hypothetical protein VGD93_00705, partial [Devosia sp.]
MSIETLRQSAARVLSAASLALATLVVGTEWLVQGAPGPGAATAVGCALALGALYATARNGSAFRYAAVSVLMGEVMAMLVAMRGQPLQIDMHMLFFAALALSALLYDVRALLLGTALVAVHHLGLGLAMESLVFYGGSTLERVATHAAILLAEAGALVWLTATTQRLTASLASESQNVRALAAE